MASKTNDKLELIDQSPKRRSSLFQSEPSQPSPSSRFSISSCFLCRNEEPVTSNMDISTGHMILSYMEDHLNNKNRFDREWEALCAYEAEPYSTSAAELPQNINKNRFPGVLPYDHSRVILNNLSNISSSDYINANTIIDHDPINPAYIATQGPLPHTAADFWQMVWEQGSVVIVMLTRLMENDVAMCYRYWPEEGSEVYDIYEIHLVSEHIWCDDYLVQSPYLKNVKNSETRTVTQFHFLSWPDNGVPTSIKALLKFKRKVNKSYRGRSCPIVVHCRRSLN
ncbi:receptor-type tyrosine-protein phosphatase N2-like isoform X3 [Tachypleus tridentatus]|uniref:receptor-type tyrosine-protein phosphatase N2-like isoform X3 n=1 Tax=Tachypleus tridentatus TaxID=6853 RepID=UPI003FD3C047